MKKLFLIVALVLLNFTTYNSYGQQPIGNPFGESWNKMIVGETLRPNSHLLKPAGQTLELTANERVLNMEFVKQKKFLVVKTNRRIVIVDVNNFKIINSLSYPGKNETGSMNGLTVGDDDSTIYFTGLEKNLYVGKVDAKGLLSILKTIPLSVDKKVNPLGIAIHKNIAIVALAVSDQLAFVDLQSGKIIQKTDVGVCPYAVEISRDKKYVFVSNFGGTKPRKNDKTEKSAGKDVAVDERSVALRGSVTVINLKSKSKVKEINTRIHPEAMEMSQDGVLLYVTDDSGDGVSIINTKALKVTKTICTKPSKNLPYGSLTNALAFTTDGKTLYTANAGNNCIALIDLKQPDKEPYGFIAAGGFPGAIRINGNDLFIGNVTPLKASLQKVSLPRNNAETNAYTNDAKTGFHLIDILRALSVAKSNVNPKPIPDNVGQPSSIKHVVYIIKENKKFDQVLGGIGRGNCDSTLVEFGRSTTPNTHALADKYVLLDNYYCNGVNSSDGHQWAIQGITTPYHEKDFSNGHCAYDFGTDPLSYAGCGFIWDHLLRKGISFRNFGETDLAKITKGKTWTDFYNSWKNKNDSAQFECVYQIETLRKYSDMRYPGWNMNITDQIRADAFMNALSEYEQQGSLPEFIIIYLPNDHTNGYGESSPTPRAHVADNDLAMGRIIEALSKSSFWKDMVVFANEDDPQTGADHVDGRRSFCLVAGPYVKRNTLISTFYNQSSVLHTICRIFGVQPMNQLVAAAPIMSECFMEQPQFDSYNLLTPAVAINEMNPPMKEVKSKTTALLAPLTRKMDFSKPDLIDKNALMFSKYVWSTIHGDKPFPEKYFGMHGKGLKKLGLLQDENFKD